MTVYFDDKIIYNVSRVSLTALTDSPVIGVFIEMYGRLDYYEIKDVSTLTILSH